MKLSVKEVSVSIGRAPILRNVALEVESGELLSLLGPSGCGKSTLLKTVAGILPPERGEVWLGERDISRCPPHRRNTVIVFQDLRLFPHMTVADNVAFPLKMRGVGREERLGRAAELLRKVHLEGYDRRAVSSLSGGQQQRVALARALAAQPDLLLLDEPFSSLDEELREEMRRLVLELHREFHTTTVLVTHDQQEALSMADRVAVMAGGRILQCGPPREVYDRPALRQVAGYFGGCVYLPGRVEGGRFRSPCLSGPVQAPDGPYDLMLRGSALQLDRPGPLALRLEECRFRGADALTRWSLEDGTVLERALPLPIPWAVGESITCQVDWDRTALFPADGGEGVAP